MTCERMLGYKTKLCDMCDMCVMLCYLMCYVINILGMKGLVTINN